MNHEAIGGQGLFQFAADHAASLSGHCSGRFRRPRRTLDRARFGLGCRRSRAAQRADHGRVDRPGDDGPRPPARLAGDAAVQVLGVCDVDRLRCEEGVRLVDETYAAERAAGTYRGCTAYNDYRELLARTDLDAVVIATPDHWHTLQAIDAAKAGKDVYCEKPVSLTIHEGRRLAETIRRYGRVFQTGTQYRSIPTIRKVCEFVRGGGLGRVKSVFTIWNSLHSWIGSERFRPYVDAVHVQSTAAARTCRWISPCRPSPCRTAGLGPVGRSRSRGTPTTACITRTRPPAWCPGRSARISARPP